jgi:oligoendopeptidase F
VDAAWPCLAAAAQWQPWLTEAFAIYNELRFRDQLYQQAQDPRAKAYYLKSLLDDMVLQLFTSSEEAQLEQSIYQGVAARHAGHRR